MQNILAAIHTGKFSFRFWSRSYGRDSSANSSEIRSFSYSTSDRLSNRGGWKRRQARVAEVDGPARGVQALLLMGQPVGLAELVTVVSAAMKESQQALARVQELLEAMVLEYLS
jgi:hypothetical protein